MGVLDRLRGMLSDDKEEGGGRTYSEKGRDDAHEYTREDGQGEVLGEYDGRDLRDTYIAAVEAQREEKDRYFRLDPHSPIPHDERADFSGLDYYEPTPELQFTLPLEHDEPQTLTFQTSTGDERDYTRVGTVRFAVDGQEATLAIYSSDEGEYFLPFRDATSGKESYGAGRYLEPIAAGDGQLLVDFNLAYNPFCAYSEVYSCPLPPIENWLKVPIRAGERDYKK